MNNAWFYQTTTLASFLSFSFSSSAILDSPWVSQLIDYPAVSPWLHKENKMADMKTVLLASEAELYVQELKPFPIAEIGSPK